MSAEDPHAVRQNPKSVSGFRPDVYPDEVLEKDLDPAPYFVDSLGRHWFLIPEGRHGPGQMLFSRLLHPIVPVSDIVARKTRKGFNFYSYHTPLKDVRSQTSTPTRRLWEEAFFLWVMKDVDKRHNLSTSPKAHAWFDLETIPIFFMDPRVDGRTDSFVTERIREAFLTNALGPEDEGDIRLRPLTSESFKDWMWVNRNPKGITYMRTLLQSAQKQWSDKAWVRGVVDGIVAELKLPIHTIMHFPKSIRCQNHDCYVDALCALLHTRIAEVSEVISSHEHNSTH